MSLTRHNYAVTELWFRERSNCCHSEHSCQVWFLWAVTSEEALKHSKVTDGIHIIYLLIFPYSVIQWTLVWLQDKSIYTQLVLRWIGILISLNASRVCGLNFQHQCVGLGDWVKRFLNSKVFSECLKKHISTIQQHLSRYIKEKLRDPGDAANKCTLSESRGKRSAIVMRVSGGMLSHRSSFYETSRRQNRRAARSWHTHSERHSVSVRR